VFGKKPRAVAPRLPKPGAARNALVAAAAVASPAAQAPASHRARPAAHPARVAGTGLAPPPCGGGGPVPTRAVLSWGSLRAPTLSHFGNTKKFTT
jgi:hypothetical protein